MFEIAFKKSVFKDLKRIDKVVLKRIFNKLENDLLKRPEDFTELKGKFAGLRKYRVVDYRVIYGILGQQVLVTRVSHRKEA
jgi:mRNA interferase RelE/StbE